jgi:hypothetical protein
METSLIEVAIDTVITFYAGGHGHFNTHVRKRGGSFGFYAAEKTDHVAWDLIKRNIYFLVACPAEPIFV